MKRSVLDLLLEARRSKRAAVLVTRLESGEQEVLFPLEPSGDRDDAIRRAAVDAARTDRALLLEHRGAEVFLRPFNPPLRMVLVGAVHIAQPLAAMAGRVGFAVVVVDPRSAFATEARFPGVELVPRWPAEALEELRPDHRTAVVTLTHDPKLDDPALAAALESPAFYLGALGSRRTHGRRLDRLRKKGFEESELRRIHGPVGLDIGARSPAEIAVSILAEVVARMRGGNPDARGRTGRGAVSPSALPPDAE